MLNLPSIIKNRKARVAQGVKDRALKNREAVLDIMSRNIKGARSCPRLLGQKCLGEFCEFFREFSATNNETGKVFTYYKCVDAQAPTLAIELIREVKALKEEVQGLRMDLKNKQGNN